MTTQTKVRPEDLRISDENARLILERAIQLDAQRPGDTTLAELQRVAQDLNVSSGALMEAIRELQTKAVAPPAVKQSPAVQPLLEAPVSSRGSWWRTLAITLGSFVFAAFNLNNDYEPTASMLLLFGGTIALILMHRRNRTPGQFQRDLLGMFGAVALCWGIAGRGNADAVVYLSTFGWLFSSTVGGWITRFRWGRQPKVEVAAEES